MSLGNTPSHEAAMTTDAFGKATALRNSSSVDNVSADLTTASPSTHGNNTTMTLIGLNQNQPDQTNNPFHYVAMYFNMINVPVGLVLNVLCVVVLINSKIVRTSTGVELLFLALADSINLIVFFVASSPVWSEFSDIPD